MADAMRPCIVVDTGLGGVALMLGNYDDGPRGGILLHGDEATLFPNRRAARRAIQRSSDYAAHHGYRWGIENYQIQNVEPPR